MGAELVAIIAPCDLWAQARAGTISGIAVDSMTGGPLRSAYVVLDGSSHSAISDSLGRFVMPDVPPGRYRAVLLHEREVVIIWTKTRLGL